MAKKDRITIKDVARVANVTPQTVSRAFRNTDDISAETRDKILKIAADMDYVRNVSAGSLRNGSTKLIAIIYDNVINSYFSIITHFFQRSFSEKGYSVLTFAVDGSVICENDYLKVLEHNVDGIISFLGLSEKIPELVAKYKVPVLVAGRDSEKDEIDCVYLDDREIGRIAARKFIEIGCERPLYISEALSITCANERFEGFKEEFEKLGIIPQVISNENSLPFFMETPLLETYKTHPFDCIFCFNDMLAFEVLYHIEKNGLPSAKVIGVDNVQQEIYFPKRLTTVGWDKNELVKESTEILLKCIKKESESLGAHKQISAYLVEGYTA